MLRAAALSIALSVLEAACALTEPPPPPGTRLLQVEVQNGFVQPAQLAVGTEQAVIIGAAQAGGEPRARGGAALDTRPVIGSAVTNADGGFRIEIESSTTHAVRFSLVARRPSDQAILHLAPRTWELSRGRVEYVVELPPRRLGDIEAPATLASAVAERATIAVAQRNAVRAAAAMVVSKERDVRDPPLPVYAASVR